jgi:hypothetical protein
MKREWHNYGSAVIGLSAAQLRERLPQPLRERLLDDPVLRVGVCADAADAQLLGELDGAMHVGQSMDVVRRLKAEVDRANVAEYEYYLVSFPDLTPIRKSDDVLSAQTVQEYLDGIEFRWPAAPEMRVREVHGLRSLMERMFFVTTRTRELLEHSAVTGVQYVEVRGDCWWMQVSRRVPCRADDIVLPTGDYDPATRSVAGPYLFGLRYERSDFGPEDLQLVDRIVVGNTTYLYRRPWLVASRRFVEICLLHKVNRLQAPNVLFKRGFVPVLVGRGRITSVLSSHT